MDENLPRLIRELRSETCPEDVFVEAARRISAQAPSTKRFGYGISLGFATLGLLCCLILWRWPAAPNSQHQSRLSAPAVANRAQVARQTEAALEFIGGILVDAGDRSQRAILNQAVPPLRSSIDTARDKTISRIKL